LKKNLNVLYNVTAAEWETSIFVSAASSFFDKLNPLDIIKTRKDICTAPQIAVKIIMILPGYVFGEISP